MVDFSESITSTGTLPLGRLPAVSSCGMPPSLPPSVPLTRTCSCMVACVHPVSLFVRLLPHVSSLPSTPANTAVELISKMVDGDTTLLWAGLFDLNHLTEIIDLNNDLIMEFNKIGQVEFNNKRLTRRADAFRVEGRNRRGRLDYVKRALVGLGGES